MMEISRKRFAGVLLATFLCATVFGALINVQFPLFTRQYTRIKSNVYIFKETSEGIEELVRGNTITDIGEKYVRDQIGFDNATNWNFTQWIAVGNSTITTAKTKLDTEATGAGFARAYRDAIVPWINGGDYAYNITNMFTASATITINAASCHWNGTSNLDNNMYALASLGGSETFNLNDNCTIRWVLTFNGN